MGDFVSRSGPKNRVEIIDDEDDEIEEINTVGVEINRRYQAIKQKWCFWRIPGVVLSSFNNKALISYMYKFKSENEFYM